MFTLARGFGSGSGSRSLTFLIYIGLACRVLVPTGFMPAPLSEGGPIVPCPGGLVALSAPSGDRDPGAHHDREHDGAQGHSGWGSCAFGAAPCVYLPGTEYELNVPCFTHVLPERLPEHLVRTLIAAPYQARAPPLARSIEP